MIETEFTVQMARSLSAHKAEDEYRMTITDRRSGHIVAEMKFNQNAFANLLTNAQATMRGVVSQEDVLGLYAHHGNVEIPMKGIGDEPWDSDAFDAWSDKIVARAKKLCAKTWPGETVRVNPPRRTNSPYRGGEAGTMLVHRVIYRTYPDPKRQELLRDD